MIRSGSLPLLQADCFGLPGRGEWNLPYEEVLRDFETRDRTLQVVRSGAYLLWFEADLYDQPQLIQILAMLHELQLPPERIRLISIGECPDIAHFGGLGS